MKGKSFKLYLSVDDRAIGSVLIQESEGKEHVVYYLSRRLLMQKPGIPQLKNFAYVYTSLVPNLGIICYQLNASSSAKSMSLSICCLCDIEWEDWQVDSGIIRI